ncbi:MAG: hypothetical protein SAL70_34410 [Scytonema sp. PMC 1070.18]|nr:hypothetical protein [Scytonema sp. PMC 1070.18]
MSAKCPDFLKIAQVLRGQYASDRFLECIESYTCDGDGKLRTNCGFAQPTDV